MIKERRGRENMKEENQLEVKKRKMAKNREGAERGGRWGHSCCTVDVIPF